MTADWMVYCALWSLAGAAGAGLIEAVLRRGRAPLRAIWAVALLLSIVGPVVGYFLPRASVSAPVASMSVSSPVTVVLSTSAAPRVPPPHRTISTTRVLAIGWGVLSSAMLLYVVGGLVHLRRLRRSWRAATVGGTRVMISEDTGPAVVGTFRSSIVIPEWVLGLDARYLALVLRHEQEHQRAGDAALLALAQLILVATPWNPIAWWQVRRLRLAIELDCDARVLRSEPDVRSYGQLLIHVVGPRQAFRLAGASLADRAGDLERRIRMMNRRTTGVSKVGVTFSMAAGVVAIVAGCGIPAPQRPAPAPAEARPNTGDTSQAVLRTIISRAVPPAGGAAATSAKAGSKAASPDTIEAARLARRKALLKKWTDSISPSAARRAMQPFPFQSDSAAAASEIPACSFGSGTDDAYVVKLLVADSLARREGQIDLESALAIGGRTSITIDDAERGWPLISCGTISPGTIRLYGGNVFAGAPIVLRVSGPTSVVVVTGAGRLLAGPIVVENEIRKYQMTWSAAPRSTLGSSNQQSVGNLHRQARIRIKAGSHNAVPLCSFECFNKPSSRASY